MVASSKNTVMWQIANARLAGFESSSNEGDRESAASIERNGGLVIENGNIERVTHLHSEREGLLSVDLHGLSLYPGLINGHDSLLASYHPFRGPENPYSNWLLWDNALKSSALFRERLLLSPADLYQLGSYRNALSAATTVVDHIPHHVRRPHSDYLLPYLLPDFGIAHSACSYSLNWGEGIAKEYEYAVQNDLPFIIHIAEGFDQESRHSLRRLKELGALGQATVLVHGLSLSEDDLDLIAQQGAHLVWCPESNLSIYGLTLPIEKALERGINVCLGTDSAMTGSVNLFSTIRAACSYYFQESEQRLSPRKMLSMLTENAAAAFRLPDRGKLKQNRRADFFVLRGKYPQDPLLSLCEAEIDQLVLVVCNGAPLYAEESLEKIFTSLKIAFDRVRVKGATRLVRQHAPEIDEGICKLVKRVSGNANFHFLPIIVDIAQ